MLLTEGILNTDMLSWQTSCQSDTFCSLHWLGTCRQNILLPHLKNSFSVFPDFFFWVVFIYFVLLFPFLCVVITFSSFNLEMAWQWLQCFSKFLTGPKINCIYPNWQQSLKTNPYVLLYKKTQNVVVDYLITRRILGMISIPSRSL